MDHVITPQRGADIHTPSRRNPTIPIPKYLGNDSIDVDTVAVADNVDVPPKAFCVVGEALKEDADLMAALDSFQLQVIFSKWVLFTNDFPVVNLKCFILQICPFNITAAAALALQTRDWCHFLKVGVHFVQNFSCTCL